MNRSLRRFLALAFAVATIAAPAATAGGTSDSDAYWRTSYRLNLARQEPALGSAEDAYWRTSYRLNLARQEPALGSAEDAYWRTSYRLNLARRDAAAAARVVSPPEIVTHAGGGFDWGDAGIGAGITAGIAVLLGALALAAGRRRHRLQAT